VVNPLFTEYELVVSVQDLREDADGVFAAFVDLRFDSDNIIFADTTTPSDDYDQWVNGQSRGSGNGVGDSEGHTGRTASGLLPHLGGLAGIDSLSGDELQVFSKQFKTGADANGIRIGTSCPSRENLHATLIYESDYPLPCERIDYGSFESGRLAVPEPAGIVILITTATLLLPRNRRRIVQARRRPNPCDCNQPHESKTLTCAIR